MNNTMNRVNGIFEKDFGIKLIIQDLPNIILQIQLLISIFSNSTRDPSLNLQLQQMLTQQVGNGNYDMGHVFNAAGGNGNAGCIGCICTSPTTSVPRGKGSGYTSQETQSL
jgi:hypothetical protein